MSPQTHILGEPHGPEHTQQTQRLPQLLKVSGSGFRVSG